MRLVASLLALVLLAPVTHAWVGGPDRPHHADIAVAAIDRLPADWRARIEAHLDAYRRGALDPDGITDPGREVHTFYHAYEPATGTGGGVYRVELQLHEATMAIREARPDADVAYAMGFLAHFASDLAVPFHTANGLYEHELHETYEHLAYDMRESYQAAGSRPPREVEDPAAYARDVATRSEAMAAELLAALDASGGSWSPEVARVAERSATLAIDATADLLYTAIARADPARPEPVFDAPMPVPGDLDDLGVGVRYLRDAHPALVVVTFLAVAALAVAAVVGRRRRPSG